LDLTPSLAAEREEREEGDDQDCAAAEGDDQLAAAADGEALGAGERGALGRGFGGFGFGLLRHRRLRLDHDVGGGRRLVAEATSPGGSGRRRGWRRRCARWGRERGERGGRRLTAMGALDELAEPGFVNLCGLSARGAANWYHAHRFECTARLPGGARASPSDRIHHDDTADTTKFIFLATSNGGSAGTSPSQINPNVFRRDRCAVVVNPSFLHVVY
jgi:hypothetical protein